MRTVGFIYFENYNHNKLNIFIDVIPEEATDVKKKCRLYFRNNLCIGNTVAMCGIYFNSRHSPACFRESFL